MLSSVLNQAVAQVLGGGCWEFFWWFFLAAFCRFGWRKWMQMRKDMENVETQLADHYEYAAWLCERLDSMTWMRDAIHALGERLDQLSHRISTNADDTRDALTVLDDATDVVRYGLMEFGGFVRNQSLTGQQRTHMFTQERANFVLWNMQRNRPDDTDPLEDAEEERLTDDEVEPSSTEGMSNLMDAMRREQNIALTREAWEDASMIQQALITILDASSGTNPVGMTMAMGVIERIRGIFQRLHRLARDRGHNDRAGSYLRYVEDLHGIMRGWEFNLAFQIDSFSERSAEETVTDAKRFTKEASWKLSLFEEEYEILWTVLMCGMAVMEARMTRTKRDVSVGIHSSSHGHEIMSESTLPGPLGTKQRALRLLIHRLGW